MQRWHMQCMLIFVLQVSSSLNLVATPLCLPVRLSNPFKSAVFSFSFPITLHIQLNIALALGDK